MIEGKDCVGIGVGAIVITLEEDIQKLLLAKRGKDCRNEQFKWEFPGGGLEFGETLEAAVKRELMEECGIEVKIIYQLKAFDHILGKDEHWVSVVYVCEYVSGELTIKEPNKCEELKWLAIDQINADELTTVSKDNLDEFIKYDKFQNEFIDEMFDDLFNI